MATGAERGTAIGGNIEDSLVSDSDKLQTRSDRKHDHT